MNELRNRRPQEQLREIPDEVLRFQPATPLQLDRSLFARSLRGAPSRSSAGPGNIMRLLLPSSTVVSVVGCVAFRSRRRFLVPRIPIQLEYMQPVLFRTLLLERMRLPLQITEARCECGSQLDKLGRHRGACPRSGRLRSRALPIERTLARVCREAGASVA